MKKFFLLLFAFTGFLVSKAQTGKGDWMVGGGIGLNTSDNNTLITVAPDVGYFFVNNLALGGNFSLTYSKTGNNKYTTFGIGPFARYYFTTQTQTVRPLLHTKFSYLSTKNKINNTVSSTNNGINYFIGGGAAAFISQNVSIDAVIGYDHTKYTDLKGSGGLAFTIGFQVYLLRDLVDRLRGN